MKPIGSHTNHHGKRRRSADEPRRPDQPPGLRTGAARPGPAGGAPGARDHRPRAFFERGAPLAARGVQLGARPASPTVELDRDTAVSVTVGGTRHFDRALLAPAGGELLTRLPRHPSCGLLAHEVEDDFVLVLWGPLVQMHGVSERIIGVARLEPQTCCPVVAASEAHKEFRELVKSEDITASLGFDRAWVRDYVQKHQDHSELIDDMANAYNVQGRPPRGADEDERTYWQADQIVARHIALAYEVAESLNVEPLQLPHGSVFVDPTGELYFFEDVPVIAPATPTRRPAPGPAVRRDSDDAEDGRPTRDVRARLSDTKVRPHHSELAPDPLDWPSYLAPAAHTDAHTEFRFPPARPERPSRHTDQGASSKRQSAGAHHAQRATGVSRQTNHVPSLYLQMIETGTPVPVVITGVAIVFMTQGRARCFAHVGTVTDLRATTSHAAAEFLGATGETDFRVSVISDQSLMKRLARQQYDTLPRSSARLQQFLAICGSHPTCTPEFLGEVIGAMPPLARESDIVDAVIESLAMIEHHALATQASMMGIGCTDATGLPVNVTAVGNIVVGVPALTPASH